jgi:uncharacterized protein (DUF302 family)
MAPEGVVTIPSNFGPRETIERLKVEIAAHGLDLFAEIDHAQNAKEAALTLPPETVLVFGNAKAGTPLMQANQAAGIDLPLKALVWLDAAGKTWISYSDPVWIAKRHGLPAGLMPIAEKMRDGLEAIAGNAAGPVQ